MPFLGLLLLPFRGLLLLPFLGLLLLPFLGLLSILGWLLPRLFGHTDIRTPMTFNFITLMIGMTSNQLGVVFLDSELTSADSYSGV